MNLLRELQDLVQSYLEGERDLEGLRDQLADLALPIAEADDPEASTLAGSLWRLISEHGYGHRSEEDLRRALRRTVPAHAS